MGDTIDYVSPFDIDLYYDFREWEMIFDIVHYRGRVGFERGIEYIIHTNEVGKHNLPHLHAKYQNSEAVIELTTGKVLAGNLKPTQNRMASEWVIRNDEMLRNRWNELTKGIKVEIV